jgi:uncharacterized metal-binding protein YceD (DUF177 family)
MSADRVAEAVERLQRGVAIVYTGSPTLPHECQRCTGVHVFGESCVDAALRVAREKGIR